MSEFKSEVLPSGVLIRKIKDDDNNYVLTCQGQAIIVSKLDIARMDGIVYPTKRLSEKCCNVPQQIDVPDINVGDMTQTEAVDKYKENVRKVMEEMAYSDYPGYKNSGHELPQYEINKSHEKARIAVRLQAEAVDLAMTVEFGSHRTNKEQIQSYLRLSGLIPAQEPFHCNNKVTDKGICTTQCDRCKVSDYHFQ